MPDTLVLVFLKKSAIRLIYKQLKITHNILEINLYGVLEDTGIIFPLKRGAR